MAKQSAHGPGAVENPKSPSVLDISSSYWLEETRGSPDCAFVKLKGRMPFVVVDSSPCSDGRILSGTGPILNEGKLVATGVLRRVSRAEKRAADGI